MFSLRLVKALSLWGLACCGGVFGCRSSGVSAQDVDAATSSRSDAATKKDGTGAPSSSDASAETAPESCQTWSRPFFGTQGQSAYAVLALGTCDAIVAGTFAGTSDLGTTPTPNAQSESGPSTMYLARLTGDGAFAWKKLAVTGEFQVSQLVLARHPSGDFVLAGILPEPITLDGTTLTPVGALDWFVARFTPAGALVFARVLGSAATDLFGGLAVAADGSILLSGTFLQSATIDGVPQPEGGVVVSLDGQTGARRNSVALGASEGETVDVSPSGRVAVVAETLGQCVRCDIRVCPEGCDQQPTTATVRMFGADLAPVAETPILVTGQNNGSGINRSIVGLRFRADGILVVMTGQESGMVSFHVFDGDGNAQGESMLDAPAFLSKLELLPSGGLAVFEFTNRPTLYELDDAFHVVRSRWLTDTDDAGDGTSLASVYFNDFSADTRGGVVLGGYMISKAKIVGQEWDAQGAAGSAVARVDSTYAP